MVVYYHLCFLKYYPSVFQQCYTDSDTLIMVYNKGCLPISCTGLIRPLKMSINGMDNFPTFPQYNLDPLAMLYLPVKKKKKNDTFIIILYNFLNVYNYLMLSKLTSTGVLEHCMWPLLVRIIAFNLRIT